MSLSCQAQSLNKAKIIRFCINGCPLTTAIHLMRLIITFKGIDSWSYALTGTKDITSIIRTARPCHNHIIRSDFSIVLDNNCTYSTTCWCCWSSVYNIIPSYCSFLTTTIDRTFYLSSTLNGDSTISTYQSRVAMSCDTLACTEHITSDNRGKFGIIICSTFHWCLTDGNYRVLFYTANLTTAIDITSTFHEVSCIKSTHCTIGNDNSCSTIRFCCTFTINTNHSSLTIEGIRCSFLKGFTLAATEHITCNRSSITGRNRFDIYSA